MPSRHIDQLTAHPRSTTNPLRNTAEIAVRDAALASDNTRKVTLGDIRAYHTNVLDYGADNSGTNDSTAAFQAAIDACTQGGICFVPKGGYLLNSKVILRQGCLLMGQGPQWGSYVSQPNGVNDHCFQLETDGAGYCHGTMVANLQILKNWGNGGTDTVGSGIYAPNNMGENTKIINCKVSAFPQYGIYVAGAITGYFQDLSLFGNGNVGLGLANEAGKGFTGHYCLGISGDGNGQTSGEKALIGLYGSCAWITGVKAESHDYAVHCEFYDNGWLTLNEVTHSNFGGEPPGIVHIAAYAGWNVGGQVAIQGIYKHGNAYNAAALIVDDNSGRVVDIDYNNKYQYYTIYSCHHGVIFSANVDNGCLVRTASDPTADDLSAATFALGHTNGDGTSGVAAVQGKSGGGTAPASLTVNKWVRAQLDGVNGWIPFFT